MIFNSLYLLHFFAYVIFLAVKTIYLSAFVFLLSWRNFARFSVLTIFFFPTKYFFRCPNFRYFLQFVYIVFSFFLSRTFHCLIIYGYLFFLCLLLFILLVDLLFFLPLSFSRYYLHYTFWTHCIYLLLCVIHQFPVPNCPPIEIIFFVQFHCFEWTDLSICEFIT